MLSIAARWPIFCSTIQFSGEIVSYGGAEGQQFPRDMTAWSRHKLYGEGEGEDDNRGGNTSGACLHASRSRSPGRQNDPRAIRSRMGFKLHLLPAESTEEFPSACRPSRSAEESAESSEESAESSEEIAESSEESENSQRTGLSVCFWNSVLIEYSHAFCQSAVLRKWAQPANRKILYAMWRAIGWRCGRANR